jgi:Methyltransferase domain
VGRGVTEDEELAQSNKEFPLLQSEVDRIEQRRWILQYARKGGIGAEIGVFRGQFSVELIKGLKPKKVYLVDPWTKLGDRYPIARPYNNNGALTPRVSLRETQLRTGNFKSAEVVIVEGFFPQVIRQIKEPLDWVYLDGSHSYFDVLRDLHNIDHILKWGGTILGDDWWPDSTHPAQGVYPAVQQFVRTSRFQIHAAGPGGQYCLRRREDYAAKMLPREGDLAVVKRAAAEAELAAAKARKS